MPGRKKQPAKPTSLLHMYNAGDVKRLLDNNNHIYNEELYRSDFYRDYGRVIHSACFRRLQGKTQLFPSHESDYFRNRLTHSMEVSQIGKAITNRINYLIQKNIPNSNEETFIDVDLIQFSCLAHDLGHPPFGHQGELELDTLMQDFGGFEGNAQTLRILSKLEKKIKSIGKEGPYGFDNNGEDHRFGLNLTSRSLASVLKYDYEIPVFYKQRGIDLENNKNPTKKKDPAKGYYYCEKEVIAQIKKNVLGKKYKQFVDSKIPFKTVECQIMDLADDIAYSSYDLEDSLKAGFINLLDLVTQEDEFMNKIASSINLKFTKKRSVQDIKEIIFRVFQEIIVDVKVGENVTSISDLKELFESRRFSEFLSGTVYNTNKLYSTNGYYRTELISRLIGKFIRSINIEFNKDFPMFSKIYIDEKMKETDNIDSDCQLQIEVLKTFTFELQISSNRLKIAEYRGREIVRTIFNSICESDGQFLPEDYYHIYRKIKNSKQYSSTIKDRYLKRTVCDFVAATSDKYATEFYGKLKSENPQSIFKKI